MGTWDKQEASLSLPHPILLIAPCLILTKVFNKKNGLYIETMLYTCIINQALCIELNAFSSKFS
jgi:hypothetical protein